ncbi:MAG TPA: hypothetical protein PL182_07205 [Pseudobdellovibrionaceae bacterium]|nr:hypothetical protein [Pseudobdellovibrionaceae bacterium]
MDSWLSRAEAFDWDGRKADLQRTRQQPMFDRAFTKLLTEGMGDAFAFDDRLTRNFLEEFDRWIHGSALNEVGGLAAFPQRDLISGVTNFLDDLHFRFGPRLVCMEREYAYHRRVRPEMVHRRLETLEAGDVLVFAIPFAYHGDLHPQTRGILDRCSEMGIPVHVDAAWYGCLRDFRFDYDHPAVHSVGFSLSKGLGLGSQRCGVRYSRLEEDGPIRVINDFGMEIRAPFACGLKFMKRFGSDYLQEKYGEAYRYVCRKYDLRPTKAIHVAMGEVEPGEWWPLGLRPFLRYLVEERNEFKTP